MGSFVVGNWKQILALALGASGVYAGLQRLQATVEAQGKTLDRVEARVEKLIDRVSWGERSDQGEAGPAPPPQ